MTVNVLDVVCDARMTDGEAHEFLIHGLTRLVSSLRDERERSVYNIPIDALETAVFDYRYNAEDVAYFLNRLIGEDKWEAYDRDDDLVENRWGIRRIKKPNGV